MLCFNVVRAFCVVTSSPVPASHHSADTVSLTLPPIHACPKESSLVAAFSRVIGLNQLW